MKYCVYVFLSLAIWSEAVDLPNGCEVMANTESGVVCGRRRNATDGEHYASFRGIRYAKAPRGKLRFAEPQKPDNFTEIFDATEHGPICPQVDVCFGPLMQPRSMDEDCLRINVHIPLISLPDPESGTKKPLLPVLVHIHGGSFSYGSGDSDIRGPEYLMAGKGIVLVTFNYRLNVFGFLSLYSRQIPGNAGLRDALFALKWIQNNIKNFGGDPSQVTLAGQSAGALMAHALSISPAVKGLNLFQRVLALSGNAIAGFCSYAPTYTTFVNTLFFFAAGISLLQSPEDIYKELTEIPVNKLLQANKVVLDITGLVTFSPVIEAPQPGFTTILPKDPEILVSEGYGEEYTLWLGFTSNETQVMRKRLEEVNIVTTLRHLPPMTLPINIMWSSNLLALPVITKNHMKRYFNNSIITLDKFLPAGTDGFYAYPAMRLAEKRLSVGAEPTYVSQFGYFSEHSIFKVIGSWLGAGHMEDMLYFYRFNSAFGPMVTNELTQDNDDSRMKAWMTDLVSEYVRSGSPVPQSQKSQWPPTGKSLLFQNISIPQFDFRPPTLYMKNMKKYYDKMYSLARGI